MDDITYSKAELRTRMRAWRRQLDEDQVAAWSAQVAQRVQTLDEAHSLNVWFIYVSVGREVATRGLINHLLKQGKTICVPRVTGRGIMEPVIINALEELLPGSLGVPEPAVDSVTFEADMDVCVVPGLAFTAAGDRLGGGLGFYDRWLARKMHRLAIGLAFDAQIVDSLPGEAHDVRLDVVVTPTRVLRASE